MPEPITASERCLSYAPPARQRAYIAAMEQLAADRDEDAPVRVYVSAPPVIADRPTWPARRTAIRRLLPWKIELISFADVFTSKEHYYEAWDDFARTLSGLVIVAHRKKKSGRIYRLGPGLRQELITVVKTGKPVLLSTSSYGLVPVVDCEPRRVGPEASPQTKLAVPDGWSRSRQAPTLAAALAALTPRRPPTQSAVAEAQPADVLSRGDDGVTLEDHAAVTSTLR